MSNNNNWKRIGGFSRTGTQNYVRTNDAAMGGTTFGGSPDVSYNTGNNTFRIGNNAGVIFINGDIDMSGGPGIAAPINRVRNVRDPIADQDVATKYYVDRTWSAIQNQQTGPTGPGGPPGIGYPGDAGSVGDTGPTGVTGPIGPTGSFFGVHGPTGANGATGSTGANGARGETGPIGPVGSKGEQGVAGSQGVQGSNGTILWLNPDGDSLINEIIEDSYLLSQTPIQSTLRTVGPISVSATYGNVNKTIPVSRFHNTAAKLSTLAVIPSGVWVLNMYAAVPSSADANQVSLYAALFVIDGTRNQPSAASLIIETKEGGDAGYYPPRAAYLPDHVKYIGRSWDLDNIQNVLDATTDSKSGVIITSTAKKLYKIQIPVDFIALKNASGNSDTIYVQLQLYAKNTKLASQTANVILYYQTNLETSETTYSYLQTTFGAVGSEGPQGKTGPVGPPGSKGDIGAAGAAGPQGIQGATGPTGTRGPQGSQGATGPTGASGHANSYGPQFSVQYRANPAQGGDTDPSGTFGGTQNFRYLTTTSTTNESDASMGTVVMNDLACKSIHSSFYIEDPSITTGPSIRPRTFVKGGEVNGDYVVLASGKDTIGGGTTKSPGTAGDITHGIKIIHQMDTNPPTAKINLYNGNKYTCEVGMMFDLTNGNISAGDRFCIVNSDGAAGVGGMTPSELADSGQSGLNRMLHVSGNVMVGTHPGSNRTKTASSAMVMFNQATEAPTITAYPGMYHRGVLGTTATTLGLTDSSGGLGITAPNFITFQTGTSTQSNSIVINSAGNVSVTGRTNLNGAVGIGRNFADTSSHNSLKSILDVSGTTHLTTAAQSFTDNPRLKLISNAFSQTASIPSFAQSTNEISGVTSSENSGFLRLSAQNATKSCIDLIGDNTAQSGYSNSIRFNTASAERMIIDSSGNVGIGTIAIAPSARLDVSGNARVTALTSASTALTTTGRIGINLPTPSTALDISGNARVTALTSASTALTTTGCVGINLPTPTTALDISGNARVTALTSASTALTTTGRIGVNKSDPSVSLHVYGDTTTKSIQYLTSPLYSFTSFRFRSPSSGHNGPRLFDVRELYGISSQWEWVHNDSFLSMNERTRPGIQIWTVPETGQYKITAAGASNYIYGNTNTLNSRGIIVSLTTTLIKGERIEILVGRYGGIFQSVTGGAGGSFVVRSSTSGYIPIIVAGGGGGIGIMNTIDYSNATFVSGGSGGMDGNRITVNGQTDYGDPGSAAGYGYGGGAGTIKKYSMWGDLISTQHASGGGGGMYSNGESDNNTAKSFIEGGAGGYSFYGGNGGFGGGGVPTGSTSNAYAGGGGGGYSGGGGGGAVGGAGGGGGSYGIGTLKDEGFNTVSSGASAGLNGYVTIEYINNNPETKQVSAIFENGFVAASDGYAINSDRRIKTNIINNNPIDDLNIIRQLQIIKHKYIDKQTHSDNLRYGVIAQEIQKILPEAILQKTSIIPSIYNVANVEILEDNKHVLKFTTPLKDIEQFNSNITLKCYDSDNKITWIKIKEVIDEYTLEIEGETEDKNLFVYGHNVDDFLLVENDAIWTVATAALQEVDRQQQADKVRIAELENQVSELETAVTSQQSIINDIVERLKT